MSIKRDVRLHVDICLDIPDKVVTQIREKLIKEDGKEWDDDGITEYVIQGLAASMLSSDRGIVVDDPIITSWDDLT